MKKLSKKSVLISSFLAVAVCVGGYFYEKETDSKNIELHTTRTELTSDQLVNMSDAIIIGTPVSNFNENTSHVERDSTGKIVEMYTPVPFKVNHVFKGDVKKNDTITIYEPAALDGHSFIFPDDYEVLKKDNKYLLILKKGPNDAYAMVSDVQGKFKLNGKEEKDNENHIGKLRKYFLERFQEK